MKIKKIYLHNFRNDEHFQFCKETIKRIMLAGAAALNIVNDFEVFLACFGNEDEAFKKILKSTATADIKAADHTRDTTFRGMTGIIRAMQKHFKPEIAKAARRLKILFDTFGNLAERPFNAASSGTYNLLQELNGNYSTDVATTGIAEWVAKLEADNNAIDALVKMRDSEHAAKTHLKMKKCRVETDRAYNAIYRRINALMVTEGVEQYAEFVNQLNTVIDRYGNILAQRAGRAKAKRKTAAKTGTVETLGTDGTLGTDENEFRQD